MKYVARALLITGLLPAELILLVVCAPAILACVARGEKVSGTILIMFEPWEWARR